MTPVQFTPIRLKPPSPADKNRIQKSSTNKTNYTIIFPFSSKPPQGWDRMFREALDSPEGQPVQTPRPQVFVHEQELRIICSLEEIPAYFLKLKAAVSAANQNYLLSLQQKVDAEEIRLRNEEELKSPEQRAIDRALDMLDYS
jgi:hypothetical protein